MPTTHHSETELADLRTAIIDRIAAIDQLSMTFFGAQTTQSRAERESLCAQLDRITIPAAKATVKRPANNIESKGAFECST